MRPAQAVLLGLALAGSPGCDGPPQSGFLWDVDLTGSHDQCAGGAADSYHEALTYVLQFADAGNGVRVGVVKDGDPVPFAVGSVAGCEVTYSSVVWEDTRDGYPLRWKIDGSATWRTAGDLACGLAPGVDWAGNEVVTVVGSDDPDYAAGCTVDLDVVGTYQGEL